MPKRTSIDIDEIKPDHTFELLLKGADRLPSYHEGLGNIARFLVRGGTWVHNIRSTNTFVDEENPIILVKCYSELVCPESPCAESSSSCLTSMYSGTKSKPVYAIASFLICKEKIYLWGLTVEGVWYQFEKNCPFRFFHHDKRGKKVYAEYLDFPANYAEARGFEISKNVALPRFASVIERLHSGEYNRLKPEVHSSCYYLSESLRFLCYRFRAGLGVTGEDLPDDRFDVYQYWQKLSVFHEDHLFTTRKEFWLLPETVKSMLASLGINKVEDIIKIEDEILGVLLTNRKKKNIYEITPVGCVTPEHIKLRSWKRRAGPITKNHLILQRINFWSARTQRKKNRRSRSDLWMAVKDMVDLVLQKDWKTLEPMLKKTGLRIVNSDFTRLEDAQGRTYQLPNFVLSEPTNLCETWNLWNLRSKKQGN